MIFALLTTEIVFSHSLPGLPSDPSAGDVFLWALMALYLWKILIMQTLRCDIITQTGEKLRCVVMAPGVLHGLPI
jgi:hypothetical protein